MKIVFTTRFRRSYERLVAKNEKIEAVFAEHMSLFSKKSMDSSLKDHALHGKLKGYRTFSLGYDLRALYRKTRPAYIFFDIGTYDDIYR